MEQRIARDVEALRSMGQATRWEFAEKMGCSERMAHGRLKRLVDEGYATKFRQRGSSAYTYVMTVNSGEIGDRSTGNDRG